MKYDLIVIGGGPGGYTGAIRAAKLGMKTALIEKADLGGTCLNRGCIPTKALLHSGEIFNESKNWPNLGIKAQNIEYDEFAVYNRKNEIVNSLREGIASLIKANKIDLYCGQGKITGEHTVLVDQELLETDFILIATGSSPAGFDPKRPILGLENTINSDDVLDKPISGDSIAIIGAGVIGIEFASYFSYTGKKVVIFAPSDRILKMMSKDVAVQLSGLLKKNNVQIITNASVKSVTEEKEVYFTTDKGESSLKFDQVITAVGRKANIDDIGLSNAKITYGRFIDVDDNMYTGKAGIYACGDVIGKVQLAHYAAASAITAVESMLSKPHSIDMSVVPSCIYTSPEIASVGKKLEELDNGKAGKFLMAANGKSNIDGVSRGFIRVVTDSEDKIAGAELFCDRATEIMGELSLAVSLGLKAEDVSKVIHPHPTVMEGIAESIEDIFGLSTHMAPKKQ